MTQRNDPRPPPTKAQNRRGSPEAVAKRRAARLFNRAVLGERAEGPDGRTERRRRRLLDELARGAARGGKRGLKPIDVLSRVHELIALGEPLSSIRKASPPPRAVAATPEVLEGLRRIHEAYAFPTEVYAFVGLDAEALRQAGILDPRPGLHSTRPRRGSRKKRSAGEASADRGPAAR